MGGEVVGRWVGVGGTFGVGVGRKIREKTAHLFLNYIYCCLLITIIKLRRSFGSHSAPENWVTP